MTATTNIIRLENITRILPGEVPVTLVKNVSLEIPRGSFFSITGPSGSGKSSLLYLMGLLDHPTEGEIYIDGQDTTKKTSQQLSGIRLSKIGFVFQFHFLLSEFTVLGNVMIPMRKQKTLNDAQMLDRANALLEQLDLAKQAHKLPSQLSGGQRQRAAIARALANDPEIILADEPTGNLDTKNAQAVFDIFRGLVKDRNITVVTVTHDPQLAGQTDRQVHIVDGKLA